MKWHQGSIKYHMQLYHLDSLTTMKCPFHTSKIPEEA